MYPVGSLLVYGRNGVCRVREIATRPGNGEAPERLYYTLKPLYTTETIIIPVDTKVALRPVLTRGQAVRITSLPALSRYYQDAYQTSDCVELLRLIKSIHEKNRSATDNGRKPGKLDERYLRLAEDQLYGELCVALDLEREEVPSYIREVLASAS